MRVGIAGRQRRDGYTVRSLECGHEQREPDGGYASTATSAFCRVCSANGARTHIGPRDDFRAVDTRNELQRLADGVQSVYVFPAGRAWGRADVAVRKLIEAAQRHDCLKPGHSGPP